MAIDDGRCGDYYARNYGGHGRNSVGRGLRFDTAGRSVQGGQRAANPHSASGEAERLLVPGKRCVIIGGVSGMGESI